MREKGRRERGMRDGREEGREGGRERGEKMKQTQVILSRGVKADANLPYPTFSSFHKMAHTSHQKDQCPWSWAVEKRDVHYHSHSSTTCDNIKANRLEPTGPLSHSLKGVYTARTTDQPFDNGDSILCTPLQFSEGISTVGVNGANCIKVFRKLLCQHKGIVVGNVLGRERKE